MFNFYNFIVLLLHLNEKTFRIKYLENPALKKLYSKIQQKKLHLCLNYGLKYNIYI